MARVRLLDSLEEGNWRKQLREYWDEEFGLDVLQANGSTLSESVKAVDLVDRKSYAEVLRTGLDEGTSRVFELADGKAQTEAARMESSQEVSVRNRQYVFHFEKDKALCL